jgi:hypothetical protein
MAMSSERARSYKPRLWGCAHRGGRTSADLNQAELAVEYLDNLVACWSG